MKLKVKVAIKLKNGIFDSKAQIVNETLKRLGYEKNPEFSCGKYFEFLVTGENYEICKTQAIKICSEVLINPILEDFEILEFIEK